MADGTRLRVYFAIRERYRARRHPGHQRLTLVDFHLLEVAVLFVLVVQDEPHHPRDELGVRVQVVLPVREVGLVQVPRCPSRQPNMSYL